MIRRLRLKFVCINMLIVVILLSTMLGLVLHTTLTRMEKDSVQMMRQVAAGPLRPRKPDQQSGEMILPFFRLTLDPEGKLQSCEGGDYDLSDEEVLAELIAAVQREEKETGILEDVQLRYLCRQIPEGTVMVFSDITGERHAARHLLTSCLLTGLAGIGLFLGVSILLARWAVRPVEQAWDRQKQFVGDASHELKTPLTVIVANTEILQSGSCPEEDRGRFLASTRTMAEQMRGLVEELLALTRADDAGAEKTHQQMNLSRCISDAVLPFEPIFYEKGLVLSSEIEEDIFVRGDETQLGQIPEILLDNAQKYCTPGTRTVLHLSRQGRNAILTVESFGEPLSPQEQEDIFQRFYRLDRARSLNHSYGLGLAIARQITENHSGKIWVESRNGKNCFYVRLPCVQM